MSSRPSLIARLRPLVKQAADSTADNTEGKGGVIAVCLLVSGLLWFAFSMQESYPLVLNLPTRVVNLEEGKVLSQLPPETVRVHLVGVGVSLFQVYYNQPTIDIDASLNEVDIQAADLNLPKDVRIESVTPRVFVPIVQQEITKVVPVRLRSDITLPESYEYVLAPQIFPDSVSVSAAASVVEGIEYWPTESYSQIDLRDSLVVSLALADTLSGIASTNVSEVQLSAVTREFTGGQTTVDVTVRGAPSDKKLVTLEPSSITIRYRVVLDQFNQAKRPNVFTAMVDFNDIRSDTTGSVRPYLSFPPDLLLRDVDYFPESLRYYNYLGTE